MATTDPRLALTALEILRDAGIEYAMLHGRDRLLAGDVSDVDLVVGEFPEDIVVATHDRFAHNGLHPVVMTRYDLAGTRGVWYLSADASQGVQLDFLHDPQGLGRQGVRSDALLAATKTGDFPPEIDHEHQLIYLWRKRVWKRQHHRLGELRRDAAKCSHARLVEASILVTGSSRTAAELLGTDPRPPWIQTISHPLLRAKRILTRLREPAGFWLHVPGEKVARAVVARFARFLPHALTRRMPVTGVLSPLSILSVQSVRLRPGVIVSYGLQPHFPHPDLVVDEGDSVDRVLTTCVATMSQRILLG